MSRRITTDTGRTDPHPLLRAAQVNHRAGRLEQAAQLYEKVLAERRNDSSALHGLGVILGAVGRTRQGIAHLRRAIRSDRDRADSHVELGNLLVQMGMIEEALRHAQQAGAIDTQMVAAPILAASCLETMNRLDESQEWLKKALAIDPEKTSTHIRMARLQRRMGNLDPARRMLEALLETERLPPEDERLAHHELGVILDRFGEYDAAFASFEASSAATLRQAGTQRIDRHVFSRHIERHRSGFSHGRLSKYTNDDFSDDLPTPVFLVGFPRSGTTMVEQVLASHPGVITSGEKPFLHAVERDLRASASGDTSRSNPYRELDLEQIRGLRRVYWQAVRDRLEEDPGTQLLLDKLPLNIIRVGLINLLFPESRVILALRDPRDVCLSCFMQDFALNHAMVNFLSISRTAEFYAEVMNLWLHLRPKLTIPIHELRYEQSVHDLAGEARRLADFLQLPWDDGMLRFHEHARLQTIATPSAAAVTEPVYTRAVQRWRHYERHLAPIQPTLAPFVTQFGYGDPSGPEPKA